MKVKRFILMLLLVLLAEPGVVNAGPELTPQEKFDYEAMMKAVETNNLPAARLLIRRGIKLNLREDSRASPTFLTYAAFNGRTDIVRLLLAGGANIEEINGDGATPLLAAVLGKRAETVRVLMAHKANLQATDSRGETALSYARAGHDLKMERLLLQAGAK